MRAILETLLISGLRIPFPLQCALCKKGIRSGLLCGACSLPLTIRKGLRCNNCFEPLISPTDIKCHACKFYPSTFSKQRFFWRYDSKPREIIRQIKYGNHKRLAQFVAEYVAKYSLDLLDENDYDLFIPIPSFMGRYRKRNFNFTELIASEVKKSIVQKSLSTKETLILQNVRKRKQQVSLPHKERIANTKQAFSCKLHLRNANILLVDDVVTTGATVYSAATELLEAGAQRVDLLSLARSHSWASWRARIEA